MPLYFVTFDLRVSNPNTRNSDYEALEKALRKLDATNERLDRLDERYYLFMEKFDRLDEKLVNLRAERYILNEELNGSDKKKLNVYRQIHENRKNYDSLSENFNKFCKTLDGIPVAETCWFVQSPKKTPLSLEKTIIDRARECVKGKRKVIRKNDRLVVTKIRNYKDISINAEHREREQIDLWLGNLYVDNNKDFI